MKPVLSPSPGKPFVYFRYPDTQDVFFLQQKDDNLYQTTGYQQEGFYLTPFQTDVRPALFIPKEHAELKKIRFNPMPGRETLITGEENILNPDHPRRVERAIEQIKQSPSLKKIVISNRLDVPLKNDDAVEIFTRLAHTYPHSFVYYWYHPAAGFAMAGASPELLFEYEKAEGNTFFYGKTVSLAGTKFAEENRPWTSKEMEEQQIVTEYIERILNEMRLAYFADGPSDYAQGDLRHLRTELEFIFPGKKDISHIINALHPTPAVAGMPKEDAMKLIPQIEEYDREYYTGFTGWQDAKAGRFYVNLRSVMIKNGMVSFYAGGGITAASDPDKEWTEVRRKWRIIKRVFEGN